MKYAQKLLFRSYDLEITQRRIHKLSYLTRIVQRYLTKFNKTWKIEVILLKCAMKQTRDFQPWKNSTKLSSPWM